MDLSGPGINTFSDRQELADALAVRVADSLQQELGTRDETALAVSGGSTPAPFFRRLSVHDLPWERVWITLADERWVDPRHADSNERLVRSLLLQDSAAAARFLPLKTKHPAARQGEDDCHRQLGLLPRPFAAVILGMGADGHTASLFAGAPGLSRALAPDCRRNCQAIAPPGAAHERMTLTLPVLLDTRLIIVHINGEEKLRVLEQALAEGPVAAMPVRAILHQQQVPVHVYWSP